MPDYSGLLGSQYGIASGLANGLQSALTSFRQGRKDALDEQQQALENRMTQQRYDLQLATSGLEDDGSGKFHTSPLALEKEKREDERKQSFAKFQSQLTAAEDRRKELATYKRGLMTELAKRNLLGEFDASGNLTGTKPMMGLLPGGAAPSGESTGAVNEGLLKQMIDTKQLDPTAGHKAVEEVGKLQKMQQELEEAQKVFDIAKQNATVRGRLSRNINPHAFAAAGGAAGGVAAGAGTLGVGLLPGIAGGTALGEGLGQGLKSAITLGDENSKAYRGAVDPFIDKLTKDAAGRVTPISFEKISSVMPEQGDSDQVLQTKREALERLIRSSYTFPNLKLRGLLNENDPSLRMAPASGNGALTPDEQKEFERLDAKFRNKRK